jgi:hypothetical protein
MTRARAVLTVLLAVAVVAAVPASVSATETETVSYGEHTTDTDFEEGTLTNMSVEGTGTSASLVAARDSSAETVIDTTATDGDSFSYQVDNDTAVGPGVTITGDTATESESRSFSSAGVKSLSIAGNADPTGPAGGEPEFSLTPPEGSPETTDTGEGVYGAPAVGDVDGDGTGELAYRDKSNKLKVRDVVDGTTTDTGGDTYFIAVGDVDGDGASEIAFQGAPGNLNVHDVADATTTDTGEEASGYLAVGDVDDDGTGEIVFPDSSENLKVRDVVDGVTTDTGEGATGPVSVGDVDGDAIGEIAYRDTSDNLKVRDVVDGATTDTGEGTTGPVSVGDVDGDAIGEIVFGGASSNLKVRDVADGTTADTGEDVAGESSVGDVDGDGIGEIAYQDTSDNLKVRDVVDGTTADTGEDIYNVAVGDVDGDSAAEMPFGDRSDNLKIHDRSVSATTTADIDIGDDGTVEQTLTASGGTNTTALPSLSHTTASIDITTTNGLKSAGLSFTEVSETKYPEVSINGNPLAYEGTVADGQTQTVTGQASWLQTGSNSVSFSVDNSSLSADAPTPQVGLRIDQAYQTYAAPATYVSDAYQIDRATEGSVELATVDSGTATVTWQGADGNGGWSDIASASYTSAGVKTQSLGSYPGSQVRVRVDFASSQADPRLVVDRDSVAFENHHPDVRNGTAGPTGTVRYESPTLAVDIGDQEFSTTQGDNVSVAFYVDGSPVGTTSLTSNGTASLSPPALSEGVHSWYAVATDAYGGTTTSETFSFTVDHFEPVVTDLSPSGSLASDPDEITVDLSDGDFQLDGDSVDVTFTVDGQAVGTETATSNGTVSISMPDRGVTGGDHTVAVTAADDYGNSDSSSASYQVPSTLQIYNESAPEQQLTASRVDLQFFFEESGGNYTSVTRNTTDGSINLTGFPVDKPIVAKADADGYKPRRIFIDSLFSQQRLYLLPENESFTRVTLQLQDYSGEFPQDTTVLAVERPLRNGSYVTVLGDYFGANGQFPAELAFNKRHRLMLMNTATGQSRDLGTFTPQTSGEQTLAVSVSGEIRPLNISATVDVQPDAELLPAQNVTVSATVREGDAGVKNATVRIDRIANGSATTVATRDLFDAGSVSAAVDLSGATGEEVLVTTTVHTSDGVRLSDTTRYGVVNHSSSNPTILGSLDALVGQLPQSDRGPFALSLSLVVTLMGSATAASKFALSTEVTGLIALMFLTAFAIVGFVGYDIVFVGIVAWVALVGVRGRI